ncbi:hypothetical protein DOY81_004597, partial [Sarcophaga bullata]
MTLITISHTVKYFGKSTRKYAEYADNKYRLVGKENFSKKLKVE